MQSISTIALGRPTCRHPERVKRGGKAPTRPDLLQKLQTALGGGAGANLAKKAAKKARKGMK